MKIPKGFRFGGVAAGLKPQRRDVALVVSDVPAAAAGQTPLHMAVAYALAAGGAGAVPLPVVEPLELLPAVVPEVEPDWA